MTKVTVLCLATLLTCALFLRTYRLNDLLGFYYDQGRDAKVIWDLWHNGNIFLIGPTTGIEGIFLGPFYYYFIAPFYLLGNGTPVAPAIWLALVNVGGIAVMFFIAKKYFGLTSAFLTAFFLSFSLNFVQSHRWLANPTPLPLFAALCVWFILAVIHSSQNHLSWALLGLCIGLSLQLEAASAIFFFPSTLLIFFVNRQAIHFTRINLILLIISFFITLLPQLVFDLIHDHILSQAFHRFLLSEQSFRPALTGLLNQRLIFYFDIFSTKFAFGAQHILSLIVILTLSVVFSLKKLFSPVHNTIYIWWLTPLVSLLFYHGNHGYVWEYYFTGAFPFFILSVSVILAAAWTKRWFGKLLVSLFVLIFTFQNFPRLKNYLSAGVDGPVHVTLGSSLPAVNWVFQDAGSQPFNVDAYVPPVISHSYDYLFLWLGSTQYHTLPATQLVPLLYTVFEQDPPHPERLETWLARQKGIGIIELGQRFGGVTSQRRKRSL